MLENSARKTWGPTGRTAGNRSPELVGHKRFLRLGYLAAAFAVALRWLAAGDFPARLTVRSMASPAARGAANDTQLPSIPTPARAKQEPPPSPTGHDAGPPTPLTKKQRQELLKSNFEKMKQDADELESLAKSLQQDLSKSSENVLSLKVIDRAAKIEKLARKIKSEAKD